MALQRILFVNYINNNKIFIRKHTTGCSLFYYKNINFFMIILKCNTLPLNTYYVLSKRGTCKPEAGFSPKKLKEVLFVTEEIKVDSPKMELEVPEFAKDEKCGCSEMLRQATCSCSTTCPDCNRIVPYCCTTTVPANFPLGPTTFNIRRLVYDPTCLACIVTECSTTVTVDDCPPVTIPLFEVRIKGCIPFTASAEYTATGRCGGVSNTDGTPNPNHQNQIFNVCCQGCVCVDRVICLKATSDTAQAICDALNAPGGFNCTNVTATLFVNTFPCKPTGGTCPGTSGAQNVTFCGDFMLPACP